MLRCRPTQDMENFFQADWLKGDVSEDRLRVDAKLETMRND